MRGHATSQELEFIQQLEAKLDIAFSPVEELIKLAQLYIEPLHEEDRTINILHAVLARSQVIPGLLTGLPTACFTT